MAVVKTTTVFGQSDLASVPECVTNAKGSKSCAPVYVAKMWKEFQGGVCNSTPPNCISWPYHNLLMYFG